jgi:hypothetical protein
MPMPHRRCRRRDARFIKEDPVMNQVSLLTSHLRHPLQLASALVAALTLVATPPATAGTTTFLDGTFMPADWEQVIIIYVGNGGVVQSSQVTTGGNPDAYQLVHNDLRPAPPGGTTAIYAFHRRVGATFDPSAQGVLLAIDWQVDFRMTAPWFPGAAMAFGPALRQGGIIYYRYQAKSNTTWETYSATGLTAADFVPYGGTSHPDFSPLGGPIEFGYFTANGTTDSYAGSINEAGFDNWSMTLSFDETVPVRPETWSKIKALYR